MMQNRIPYRLLQGFLTRLERLKDRLHSRRVSNRATVFMSLVAAALLSLSYNPFDWTTSSYLDHAMRQTPHRPAFTSKKPTERQQPGSKASPGATPDTPDNSVEKITGFIQKGETVMDLTKKYNLKSDQLLSITKAAKESYDLRMLKPAMSYQIVVDRKENDIIEFRYAIDEADFLKVEMNDDEEFEAEKISLAMTKKTGVIIGRINNNLIESLGNSPSHTNLAFDFADLFSYDVDFTTDLRKGDSFEIVVEELYLGSVFKGYGKILFARLTNDGTPYEIVRYVVNGKEDHYRADGKSMKKTLMRAPLRFRYISSFFSMSRMHPILRISRPHLGVDYVAPTGTPISAAGDGTVLFAGYKNGFGNVITLRHEGGYETTYGHLSRFGKGVHQGSTVTQGEIIGYVGATGLATGPHLDYRVRFNNKFIDPVSMKLPSMPIPAKYQKAFAAYVDSMRAELKKEMYASYGKACASNQASDGRGSNNQAPQAQDKGEQRSGKDTAKVQ